MKFLEPIQRFFDTLDDRDFYIYCGIAFGIVVALAVGIIVWNSYSISNKQEQLDLVNNDREKVRSILSTNAQLEKEKIHLNEILDKDPNFILRDYFINLLEQFDVKADKEGNLSTINRSDIYEERTFSVEISGIDMERLTKILQAIDQNERITVKELIINQAPGNTITVSITIATLIKKI